MTVNEKHYLLNRDNLTQAFQIQLSEKQKIFLHFFFAFLKSMLNFKHLPKKVTLIAYIFQQTPGPKNMVRKMAKKTCFRGPLDT